MGYCWPYPWQKEDRTQINVGDLLKIDRTTIGQLIDCLEMKELISRKQDPQDRRQNIVLLTGSGRELVEHNVAKNARSREKCWIAYQVFKKVTS